MEATSPSSTPAPDLQSLLFTLPTELRWEIYAYLLTTASPYSKSSKIQISHSGSPIHPLLQITKEIHTDAFLPLCTAPNPNEGKGWDDRPSTLQNDDEGANVFLRVDANWRERLKKFLEILDGFSEGREEEKRRRRGMVRLEARYTQRLGEMDPGCNEAFWEKGLRKLCEEEGVRMVAFSKRTVYRNGVTGTWRCSVIAGQGVWW